MVQDQQNQCILISGESGAGKTEATKIVLRYLSKVSALNAEQQIQDDAALVLKNLVSCSPVLESFGNARTVRNDNSSRFGKLMKVKFDPSTNVVRGAFTIKYLLEKSRIITAGPKERVYHSFYLTAIGKDKGNLMYKKPPTEYVSLYSGKQLENSEFGKPEDYDEVCECMRVLNIPEDDISAVWRLAAGVVHSSCITFKADGEGSAVAPGEKGEEPLTASCKLWGIDDVSSVQKEYTTTTLVIMNKPTVKVLPPVKAIDVRDAFSKAIYDTLFSLLVEKCNARCDVDVEGNWIALLDIFGFEDFEVNSFEQLCINLANEQLQNHYNDYIFTKDMEECRKEGIDTVNITCPDNMPCLKLITEGIFPALDEVCSLGSGTDMGFYDMIVNNYNGKNAFFDKKKTARDTFIIHHYAGSVTYNVKNWLEKNRDTLKDQLKEAMRKSTVPFCAALFSDGGGEGGGSAAASGGKPVTVGAYFRNQVKLLMDLINSTNPHWIRCIKAHPAKKPKMFGGHYTTLQLESSGVLGTVKIRKAGYPVRWKHRKFALRYQAIAPLDLLIIDDAVALVRHCRLVLERAEFLEDRFAQVGKTIVFMKAETYPLLEKKRLQALQSTTRLLQKTGRGMLRRIKLYQMKYALRIQKAGRGMFGRMLAYDAYEEKNRARIQEERRKREERRKAEEEARKKFEAAVREVLLAEAQGRKGMKDAAQTFWEQFFAAEREERRETEAFVMKRMEEERKREEEERKRRELAAFLKSIEALIVPLFAEEERLRAEMWQRQPEHFNVIRFEEHHQRVRLTFELAARKLGQEEARERASIHADWYDEQEEVNDAFQQIRHLRGLYSTAAQLNQALEFSRAARKEKEEARKERAELRERSRVELLLYEGQDGVYPRSQREQAKSRAGTTLAQLRAGDAYGNEEDDDDDDGSASRGRRSQKDAGGGGALPPRRLETNNEMLMDKLKKISDMDRAAPVHARAAALAKQSAAAAENPAQAMSSLRSKLDPLKRRPLRNVEIGQRVYSHRDFCHGEVLSKRPGVIAGGVGHSRMTAAFQVRLDSGMLVWLEIDDVSEATGSSATVSSAASAGVNPLGASSSGSISRRGASPSVSRSSVSAAASIGRAFPGQQQQQHQHQHPGQHSAVASRSTYRDPSVLSGTSASVQQLIQAEHQERSQARGGGAGGSRGSSPVVSSRRSVAATAASAMPHQRVAPTSRGTNTSGTQESHGFYSNWQSRMQALENDDW